MGSYNVRLKSSAEKDLRRLPSDVLRRILAAVESLASDPFPRQSIKLTNAERLHRLRVGEYRVIYEVHGSDLTVLAVRHRRDVYRVL